jgi:hypothetical protein
MWEKRFARNAAEAAMRETKWPGNPGDRLHVGVLSGKCKVQRISGGFLPLALPDP